MNQTTVSRILCATQSPILDLLRSGQFEQAERDLESMAVRCLEDPGDLSLRSAYEDLRAVQQFYMRRDRSNGLLHSQV
jgi:hypothetical protein